MPHTDITDQKFGKWTAIKHVGSDKNKNAMWQCVHNSGEKKDISANYLRRCLRKNLRSAKRIGPEKYYLSSLCKRSHKYKNTGKSQRYKVSGGCTICVRQRTKISYEEKKGKK
jgi:hypothetical protein